MRITANQLARYMVSTETGKIGIIRDAQERSEPPRIRYSDLRQGLRAHLTSPHRSPAQLLALRQRLEQKRDDPALSPYLKEDARLSLDAADAFARLSNQIGGYDFVAAPQRQPHLLLSGVAVSVTLDTLIHRQSRGRDLIGGALFRFTKADDESETAKTKRRDMGRYAATLAYMQVSQNLCGDRQANPSLCLSIDVQFEEIHAATANYARRETEMTNACRFIAAMWGSV